MNPSLLAVLRSLPDQVLQALVSERAGALRAAALDTVADGLGLLRELEAEVERRRRG